MFKSMTIFLLCLLLIVSSTVVFGKDIKKSELAEFPKVTKVADNKYVYQDEIIKHRLTVVDNGMAMPLEVTDTLSYYNPYYINAGIPYTWLDDTVVCAFRLIPDPAYILKVRGLFATGGTAEFYLTDGRYSSTTGNMITGFGPNVFDTQDWAVVGDATGQTWDEIDYTPAGPDTIFLPWSSDPDPNDRPHFVIGYVCEGTYVQGGGEPDIFYDYNETYPWPSGYCWFSYGGATWYGIHYNAGYTAQWVFEVVVKYYNGTSPFVNSMNQLPDTWYTTNFESIVAELVDIDGTISYSGLVYQKNSEEPDTVEETSIDDNMYTFDIPGTYMPGDTISYWITVTDDEDKTVIGGQRSFLVLEPQNPGAEFLVVYEGFNGDEGLLVFEPLLDSIVVSKAGAQYEIWDVDEHNGIDNSITDYASFDHALVLGFWVGNVPVYDYSGSVWENFVNAGKNILVASADYQYVNGLDGLNYFETGDFIYDVFGVGKATSDPTDGGTSIGDEIMIGVASDPISDPWYAAPIILNFGPVFGGSNWSDWASAAPGLPNAATCFTGVASDSGTGVHNINEYGGKAVYLPFNISAMVDTTIPDGEFYIQDGAYLLMEKILEFFDVTTDIKDSPFSINTYELKANYPNPFNPTTTIKYSLMERSHVKLVVYNTLGEQVKTLVNDIQNPKQEGYTVQWDGTNDQGVKVASGIYIYRIIAGDFVASHKMVLLK